MVCLFGVKSFCNRKIYDILIILRSGTVLVKDIEPVAQSSNLEFTLFYEHAFGSRDTIVKSRNTLDLIIDLPCLEACRYLYDCNILTTNSSANKTDHNVGFISILYSSLSDDNRAVLDTFISRGIVRLDESFNKADRDSVVSIELPIQDTTTVEEFSNQMLSIVKCFQPQEIKYGYYTKEEFEEMVIERALSAVLDNGTYFWQHMIQKLNSGEIPTDVNGEVEFDDGRSISLENLCSEYARKFAYYYDEQEKKYWIDKDLYDVSKKDKNKVI